MPITTRTRYLATALLLATALGGALAAPAAITHHGLAAHHYDLTGVHISPDRVHISPDRKI